MKVAVDIRSLMEQYPSGVGGYVKNLLHALFKLDRRNEYVLFHNSARGAVVPEFPYPNARVFEGNVPNKVLHAAITLARGPRLDTYVGGVDAFFLPNLQFAAFTPSCRVVMTMHDIFFDLYPEFCSVKTRLWHRCVRPRALCERANSIIAVSQHTKNDLITHYGLEASKIHVAYSGLSENLRPDISEAEQERVRRKYQLPANVKYLLCVSNIERRKNIDVFSQLVERNLLPTGYVVVLAGALKDARLSLGKRGSASRLHYIGYIDEADKPGLYKLADMFVYPSFYEGFGFPPLEAMACGIPVIASNVSSLPEVIGAGGVLVDPYDIHELARAIELLAEDRQLREAYVRAGHQQAKKYRWDDTAQQVLNQLENV